MDTDNPTLDLYRRSKLASTAKSGLASQASTFCPFALLSLTPYAYCFGLEETKGMPLIKNSFPANPCSYGVYDLRSTEGLARLLQVPHRYRYHTSLASVPKVNIGPVISRSRTGICNSIIYTVTIISDTSNCLPLLLADSSKRNTCVIKIGGSLSDTSTVSHSALLAGSFPRVRQLSRGVTTLLHRDAYALAFL